MKSSGGVKSANRVFELLELFARRRIPLSASQVSDELCWPLSSTAALLKSLSESRYIIQSDSGRRYFPSVRLNNLTKWIPAEVFSSGTDVQALLRSLRDRFGETVTLSVRRGLQMEFIEILLGTNTVVMNVQEGDQFALFGSAIGTAALAATSPQKVAELWNRALSLNLVSATQYDGVMERISLCRAKGYYAGFDQAIDGLGALAFALTQPNAASTYVLAIAGFSKGIRAQESEIACEALNLIISIKSEVEKT
jgi:IclR family KDG regulon transcriptional repressor